MRIAFVALVVLTSAAANAKCSFPCSCFEPSGWVVTGPVVTVFDDAGMSSRSMIRVERVFGDPDAGAPTLGSLVEGGFPPGVFARGESTGVESVIDGGVSCNNVRLSVEEYAAMVQAGTCAQTLAGRGFVQPACNDHSVCGCTSVSPLLGALGVALLVLRRRASRR